MERVFEMWAATSKSTYERLSSLSSLTSWMPQHIMQSFKLKSMVTAPIVVTSVIANGSVGANNFDVFKYVDPLVGTMNGGKHVEWQRVFRY